MGQEDGLEGFGLNIPGKVLHVPHDQRVLPVGFQKSRGQGQEGGTGVELLCQSHRASLARQKDVLLPQPLRVDRFREGHFQTASRSDTAGSVGRIAGEDPGRDQISGLKGGGEGGKWISSEVRGPVGDCQSVEGRTLQRGERDDDKGHPVA